MPLWVAARRDQLRRELRVRFASDAQEDRGAILVLDGSGVGPLGVMDILWYFRIAIENK